MYTRAHGSEAAAEDPFALHLKDSEQLKAMYLDAEHEDAYHRDQSVFSDGISIEDTMNLLGTPLPRGALKHETDVCLQCGTRTAR